MKKTFVGALVGGVIIFIAQFLSWTVLNLHYKSQQYTPKQDSILAYISSTGLKSGSYFLPRTQKAASNDEMKKLYTANEGKPWAIVDYHRVEKSDMGMQMLRVFLVDFVVVWLLCWVLVKIPSRKFATIFMASIFVGLIVYLNQPYTLHIWYETPGQKGYLIDALAQWGITGIWLGWWLKS